ncbi:MAG: hotdog fold domain-containing protein [Pseudoruegeria sp.]
MSDNYLLSMYEKMLKLPLGRRVFSIYSARRAPYFRTIKPLVLNVEPNRCDIFIKKRRAVENHIGTVHVIAITNGLEMAMGFMAEASIPKNLRWIPKGMILDYTAKADSDITCTAEVAPENWETGDLKVKVTARDTQNIVVVQGEITLWVSEKPTKRPDQI